MSLFEFPATVFSGPLLQLSRTTMGASHLEGEATTTTVASSFSSCSVSSSPSSGSTQTGKDRQSLESQVRQYLGFFSADSEASEGEKSTLQKPQHCLQFGNIYWALGNIDRVLGFLIHGLKRLHFREPLSSNHLFRFALGHFTLYDV